MVKGREELQAGSEFIVTVNLVGCLRDLYPHLAEQEVIELDRPVKVAEMIARLGISSRMVLFATVEERLVPKEALIDRSCEVNLISPPAGG